MKTVSLLLLFLLTAAMSSGAGETFYLGTYTAPGKSRGIYRYELDPATGAVEARGLAVESESPSFLALHPSGKYLYAVNEVSKGMVSAFSVLPDGALHELNKQSSRGGGPTHISLDHAGKNALVANYNTGSVAALPIHEDGTLGEAAGFMQATGSGPDKKRQQGPHAHSVYVSGDDRWVFSCDLGMDRIFRFRLDAEKGMLTAPDKMPFIATKPGGGPRHLALSAGENHLYVVEEMTSTVAVFTREKSGEAYAESQVLPLTPPDFHGENSAAEVMLHPSGRYLYASNRGHDSIAVYAVDEAEGRLSIVSHTPTGGKSPRFFTIDPSGHFLLAANQGTDDVFVFRIDPQTGKLTPTGHSFKQDQPVCIVFTAGM